MGDDYPNGVAGMPQEETAERSIQSEMVPGAGPVRHTTEAPSREIETDTRRNFQHLSLDIEPTTFRPNEPSLAHRSPVEEAQPIAPQTQTLPPQRSHSSSSAESDEQLQAELQSAKSDSEKVAICKRYTKEQRRKSQKSETEIQHLKLTVQNLTEQLESTQGERSKLLELLVDAQKETAANESSLIAQIEILENKVLVLQEALTSARSGEEIPNSIHLQLVAYELSEGPTCPFSALNNHAFFHLLVTNMIQTRGTHCLGCFQKVGRIDSHPYSRCILIAAAAHVLDMQKGDVEHMRLFWRKDLSIRKCADDDPKFYKHATVAKACTYPVKREAFCGKCDNSTSNWEREFSKQFGRSNIELGQDDITETILLVQMFRGSILSIDIRHYMECQPCSMYLREVGKTMRELMMLHLAVCEKKPFADVADQCKQLKPIIFHNIAIKNRILFPMVVNVESYGIILYAQIPPYFWAVPSPSYAGRLTELDLSLIVSQIAELCSRQEQDYFDNPDNIDAKEWKETVPQPLLIFPLLNSKCGIKVNIPLE